MQTCARRAAAGYLWTTVLQSGERLPRGDVVEVARPVSAAAADARSTEQRRLRSPPPPPFSPGCRGES